MDKKNKKTIQDDFDNNYSFIDKNQIISALYKKSLGYEVQEVVEEYIFDENSNEKLIKKKTTKKDIPPDMTAVKIMLELFSNETDLDISNLTDEQLKQKIDEIMIKIKEGEKDGFDDR